MEGMGVGGDSNEASCLAGWNGGVQVGDTRRATAPHARTAMFLIACTAP